MVAPAEDNKVKERGTFGEPLHRAGHSGYIVTFVDRRSGFLIASKLRWLDCRRLIDASLRMFSKLNSSQKKTITVVNCVEFSDHLRLTRLSGMQVYFARPYCSTDRATNENTNGLLRQYFSRGTSFKDVTPQKLAAAVHKINNRPRKRLNYRTPEEVLNRISTRRT